MNSIKLDLGSALGYAEHRIRELLGRDSASLKNIEWFKSLQSTAITQSAVVHCVGMREPIRFEKIYQPTRLLLAGTGDDFSKPTVAEEGSDSVQNRAAQSILAGKALERRSITLQKFLELDEDSIIFAGPGWGKSTFLQHVFRSFIQDDVVLPILITLRRPTAVEDLERLLELTNSIKKVQRRDRFLLLVDGYDEISVSDRRRVSEALLKFQALDSGRFCLTCREYYDVFQLTVREIRIDHFSSVDRLRFIRAFLKAFKSRLNPDTVLQDLEERGFGEFLSHPLLLTLACILKTSSSTAQPRSALRLLERAIEVLCYRWDEHKGVDRFRVTPLDGKDRVNVLKRIAHTFKSPHIPDGRAMGIASAQLDRMGFDRVSPREVLIETAQFYGILARRDEGWEFVHRTIHDFLAAQYWVETGEFAKVADHEWDARTAYAACLMDDSTRVLEAALKSPHGLPTVTEILSNAPSFNIRRIIQAVIEYFKQEAGRVSTYEASMDRVSGRLETDFLRLASSRFLARLFEHCCEKRVPLTDVIAAYCVIELHERREKLDRAPYAAAVKAFNVDQFTFLVPGFGHARLQDLNPEIPQVPRLLKSRKPS